MCDKDIKPAVIYITSRGKVQPDHIEGNTASSNQATPRIVELYEGLGFELTYLDGPRRISCTGDRTAAREVLAIKE